MLTKNPRQKRLSRKQRRRRARSSSVFTSTSTDTISRADQELETAKAAALKLLNHTPDHQPELIDDQSDCRPKPKRARFEVIITTIAEEDQIERAPDRSNPPELRPIESSVHEPKPIDCSHPSSQLAPPTQPAVSMTPPDPSPSTSKIQVEDFFQVSREEIFAETAIVDAFQAALNEFQSSCHQQLGLPDSISLPQSRSEQRRISALYYGQPPAHPTVKAKKPPSSTLFLPPIINSTSSSSSAGSDLDMDEYWDMVGGQPDSEPVTDLQEPTRDLENVTREENSPVVRDDRSCSDMSSGSTSSSNSSDQLQFNSTTTLTTNPTPALSPAPLIVPEILTEAQKLLLSNALSAQYWAGYHTALFNHSIGVNPNQTHQTFNPSTCPPVSTSTHQHLGTS